MASIQFTKADVAKLFKLPNTDAVELLIERNILPVAAYTRRGRPLFDAEIVRRAAARVLREETS